MGKKKKPAREVNKSAAIRKYKEDHPEAKPAEIAEALCQDGIEVTASRVSTTLYHARMNKPKADVDVGIENIQHAVEFIKKCGSIESATKALKMAKLVAESLN